jgi:hypothetical protein
MYDTVLEVLGHLFGRTRYPVHETTEWEAQAQTTQVGKLAGEGRLACYAVKGKGKEDCPPTSIFLY